MTKSLMINKWQRGNVVLCRVPMPSTELKQFKLRPGVIISASYLNQIVDDVMIVPCTTNTNRHLTSTQYLITGDEIVSAGIRVDSVVKCESIFTINKSMIVRQIGKLSAIALNQVNQCLMVALELGS
jgi:mRNA interferase MazF